MFGGEIKQHSLICLKKVKGKIQSNHLLREEDVDKSLMLIDSYIFILSWASACQLPNLPSESLSGNDRIQRWEMEVEEDIDSDDTNTMPPIHEKHRYVNESGEIHDTSKRFACLLIANSTHFASKNKALTV